MSVLKRLSQTRLYQGWMAIAGRFGGIQTVVLLAFFYFFLMGPISAFSRLSGADYLDKRQLDRGRTACTGIAGSWRLRVKRSSWAAATSTPSRSSAAAES